MVVNAYQDNTMSVIFTLPALPLWLVLVDFLSHSVNANLTVRPTDTVVLINQTTYFNCSTSDRTMNKNVLLWYHYSLHSASREDVFDEGVITHEFMDRFKIEMDLSMGVFNLVAVRPSLADAGRYECQDGVGQGDRASAELSVLVNAYLTVRPTDTVVLINQTTYFNCSTSDRTMNKNFLLWYHYPLHSASREDVFDEGVITFEYMDRFKIEMDLSMGVFNLVAVRPSLADAGRYECQDGVGQGDRASAELSVLEEIPSCESNMNPDGVIGQNDCGLQPDVIQLTCNVNSSRGNILPTLEWKLSGDRSNSSLVVCEGSTSCNLTLKANLNFNNQSFICQTTKARRQQYGCSSGSIKVKYALRSEGSVVWCSANTGQTCTYKWYNYKDKEVYANENLGEQHPGDYVCKAECEMSQDVSCRFMAMKYHVDPSVEPSAEPSDQSGAPNGLYGLLVLIPVALIIIIALCCLDCIRRKRRKKSKKSATNIQTEEVVVPLVTSTPPDDVNNSLLEPPADLSSLLLIMGLDMVDTLTINDNFIDRGTSGAIYGPFAWKDKKCALKHIMFSPDEVTKELKEKILEKSNVCKELNSNNILKVFDVCFQPPALYIVMEYAEGRSLDKVLRPKDAAPPYPPFPLEIIRDWALQIAEGMKYLHFNYLVHRNLKAAHVLVMGSSDVLPEEQKLKIGSYTPIKEHDHATVVSNRGTMAWMAPEYIRGEPFSKSSDVWSYGVTVFEILTRDVPYKELRKETDIVRAAINKSLMPTIPDSCPQPLKDLLTDYCWNQEADKRRSFTDVCDYLRTRGIWDQSVTSST